MTKILSTLNKLKALAERGVGGEAVNAKRLMEKLMKDHGITAEQMEAPDIQSHGIRCQIKYTKLLRQIVYATIGERVNLFRSKAPGWMIIDCTSAEFIEISAKFRLYKKHYEAELEVFYLAFLQANNIFPPGIKKSRRELSKEELEMIDRAGEMAEGVKRVSYHKQLSK